ncbi:uncharacterized protein Ecym_4018 [Eremothecium cymbalariae DBVPG|uniref:Uncharacterized protein n=1 Tax=Eremothecium cymbalariae (strain CBS 270.75 / DBVPG 7215 / KCTC 17166 / NRRL Y-17582) TaxID=931890 RepID=G8JSU8_ERECY|nr:hypothetical protein Ecym_4018 [Eremothecium cymbalariae DBVPG\
MSQRGASDSSISVDYSKVAAFLEVDEAKVQELDESMVTVFFLKANEFSKMKADNMRLSISIDGLKCNFEQKINTFKEQVEKLLSDVASRQQEKQQTEDEKLKLMNEKAQLSMEVLKLRSQVEEAKQGMEIIASAKQDVTKLLEEKISDLAASKEESDRLLAANKELRKSSIDLEFIIQGYKSQELREKSEIQRLHQELNLVKSNADWLSKELESKNEQLNSFREKTNSELQNGYEQVNSLKSQLEFARANNSTLKAKTAELSNQLQEKLVETKKLADVLNTEKEEFTREMSLKQRLIDLLESQVSSMKSDLENAYQSANQNGMSTPEKDQLLDELIDTKKNLEATQAENIKLEATVNELLSVNGKNGVAVINSNVSDTSLDSKISTVPKLCGDIGILKKQLVQERRQKEELQNQVESFVVELEHKIPILNSFKERTDMLERELNDVTLLLESTAKQRDQKTIELNQYKNKINNYESQVCSLIVQRSDLAHQVQYLLMQLSVRDDAHGPLTEQEVEFVKRIISSEDEAPKSDTQGIISERLVQFKSVIELQSKNAELLNTIRQLADKLEDEEKKSRFRLKSVETQTVKEAKEAILSLQEHVQRLEDQLKIVSKERDAFKLANSANKQGDSAPSSTYQSKKLDEHIMELEKRLKNLAEQSQDNIKLLNDEIKALYKAKSEVTVILEQERSSKVLAEERLKLIQSTLSLTKEENLELHKRSDDLQRVLLKQDEKTQSTIDEIIATKSQLSNLTSKLAILTSERDFLRKIEAELKNENEALTKENTTSKILVSQLQTLQRERDILLEEAQTNYRKNIEKLESDLHETREHLVRRTREYEEQRVSDTSQYKWFQAKVDSLNEQLDNARKTLQEKTNSIETLQLHAKSLTAKLEEAELRTQSYSVLANADDITDKIETLRKNLEKANINLADAYSQIEQYKSMAKVSEQSAVEISKALEESQANYRKNIALLEQERKSLTDQIALLNDQIKDLNSELDHQKSQNQSEKSELIKKLSILQGSQRSLDELKSEYEEKISKLQEDLTQQASYANQAQKNYEQELQKHADVTKTISLLREESQKYKSEMEGFKRSASEAKSALERNEQSWCQQVADLESQLSLAQQRTEELNTQNRLLYDQVELLSKATSSDSEAAASMSAESRELIMTLRRERDILETKLDVSIREEKILRQRLGLAKTELENVRLEFSKTQATAPDSIFARESQEQIMEKLNQLNLLRESNVTLRNESKKYLEQSQHFQNEIAKLQEQLQPLESQLKSLTITISERDQQISLLKEESSRWKQRSQDILHKYERIDPVEHQKLADEVTELKNELEKKSLENLESQERFRKLRKQANERLDEFKAAKAKVESEFEAVSIAKAQLEAELAQTLDKVSELESKLSSSANEKNGEADSLKEELEELRANFIEANEAVADIKAEAASSEKDLKNQIQELTEKIKTLESEIEHSELEAKNSNDSPDFAPIVENMKKKFEEEKQVLIQEKDEELRMKLEEIQKQYEEERERELSELKASLVESTPNAPLIDEETLKSKLEAEYEKKTLERIREAEEALKKRIRLPSEERINQVIERRQRALDQEFELRVRARALELFKENPESFVGDTAKLIKEHQEEMDKLEAKFDEQLALVRKKAFEEGKQQLVMKVKLLESKIAKLEGQPNKINLNNSVPSKIPIDNNNNSSPQGAQPIAIKPSPFQVAFGKAMENTSFGSFKGSLLDSKQFIANTADTSTSTLTGNVGTNTNKRQSEDELAQSPEKRPKDD